jgi:hypothetical protein
MYAPVKTTGHRRAVLAKSLLGAALATGLTALALGVVMAQTSAPRPGSTPAASSSVRLLHAYQLRCWQYGRLVLEEGLAHPPAEGTPHSIRLQGSPGASTVYSLFDTGSSTCLVKPAVLP